MSVLPVPHDERKKIKYRWGVLLSSYQREHLIFENMKEKQKKNTVNIKEDLEFDTNYISTSRITCNTTQSSIKSGVPLNPARRTVNLKEHAGKQGERALDSTQTLVRPFLQPREQVWTALNAHAAPFTRSLHNLWSSLPRRSCSSSRSTTIKPEMTSSRCQVKMSYLWLEGVHVSEVTQCNLSLFTCPVYLYFLSVFTCPICLSTWYLFCLLLPVQFADLPVISSVYSYLFFLPSTCFIFLSFLPVSPVLSTFIPVYLYFCLFLPVPFPVVYLSFLPV